MKKWMKFMILALVPTMFLAGCDDDDDDLDLLDDTAQVMVVHASPDAPAVDLYIDDEKRNTTALNYPANTGYLEVEDGNRNVKVTAAGAGLSSPVINADVDLQEDENYTIFVANTLSNIEAVRVQDDLTEPAAGQARVRFVHLSPDAPNVDVVVPGGPTLFTDVQFKEDTPFIPVNAGTYTLEVQPVGTDDAAVTQNVTLQAGRIYTIFARGFLTPPTGNNNALGAEIIVNN